MVAGTRSRGRRRGTRSWVLKPCARWKKKERITGLRAAHRQPAARATATESPLRLCCASRKGLSRGQPRKFRLRCVSWAARKSCQSGHDHRLDRRDPARETTSRGAEADRISFETVQVAAPSNKDISRRRPSPGRRSASSPALIDSTTASSPCRANAPRSSEEEYELADAGSHVRQAKELAVDNWAARTGPACCCPDDGLNEDTTTHHLGNRRTTAS